jgi:hypothetical protein
MLWLALYTDKRETQVTTADGWTLHWDDASAQSNFHSWSYYRVAGASEPRSYTFGLSQSVVAAGIIVAYGGVRTDDPLLAIDVADRGELRGNPFIAPSLTTRNPNEMVVALFINDAGNGGSWTAPTGMTKRAEVGSVAVFDRLQRAAGPTGSQSATCSVDGDGTVDFVALTPR